MDQILKDDIRFINKFLYSIQKHRIGLGNWIDAKKRAGIEPSKRVTALFDDITEQEKSAKRIAREVVSMTAIWDEFFENVNGIGECYATTLLAEIGEISRFKTPSALWAYFGQTAQYVLADCSKGHKIMMSSDKHKTCPIFANQEDEPCGGDITITDRVQGVPKRKKGYHYLFNSTGKTLCWKIAGNLIKQGDDYYKNIYHTAKKYYSNKAEADGLIIVPAEQLKSVSAKDKVKYISLGHIDNRAKRKMVKTFLVHLWEAWREVEGLDTRPPYVIEKLGHQGYIKWAEVKELLREGRRKIKEASEEEEA